MTVEEAIKELRRQRSMMGVPASTEAVLMAILALEKEKEPAPQKAETSSNKNYPIKDDNTKLKECQEIIGRNIEELVIYHDQLSDAEKRQYVDLCFVEKVIKEIINETEKDH